MLAAVESGLRMAKLLAKKYTPKKYREPAADTATLIGQKVLNASPDAQAAVSSIISEDKKGK